MVGSWDARKSIFSLLDQDDCFIPDILVGQAVEDKVYGIVDDVRNVAHVEKGKLELVGRTSAGAHVQDVVVKGLGNTEKVDL